MASDKRPAYGRPTVQKAQRVIVNESGEFVLPVSLDDHQHETPWEGSPMQPSFVFDEEASWSEPSFQAPTQKRQIPPMRPPLPRQPVSERRQRRSSRRAYLYVVVLCLSLAGMFVLGIMMMPQLAGYFWKDFDNFAFINGELLRYDAETVAAYKQYRAYMQRDVIYPGVFVDGIHVGDLTIDQARQALQAVGSDTPNAFSVTVAIGDHTWTLDPTNVPAKRDLGHVLEQAYAIGRTNTTAIQTTQRTPFRERVDNALAIRDDNVHFTTAADYDHEAVRAIVQQIADYVTREPVDAQIQSFDYNTRTFSFTRSEPGVTVDQEALYNQLIAALDCWESGITVTAQPVVIEPEVSTEMLASTFTMIAAYTTETTKDANRNTNIDLACKAINGTALMPGETFSFNKATGQRTTDKGYRSAGAIAAGQSIEEVGGGICQVSSTLFNAVARANLQITSRSPHAWPSNYVGIGEDATVNWPDLDFKFTNSTSSPVFVITYYKDRRMSAEIWGISLGEGISIDLESTIVQETNPPADPKYVYNPNLAYGESKTTVKARTGYVVETYKVWHQNGKEIRRELLHKSNYRSYQQVIEYNY